MRATRIAAFCAEVLVGCNPRLPPEKGAAPAPAAAGSAVEPAAAPALPEPAYDPQGRRDPFRAEAPSYLASEGRETALQQFELEQLVLRGTIIDRPQPVAMVVDPEGGEHLVFIGDLVGRRLGKVESISVRSLTVLEQLVDANQRVVPQRTTIDLVSTEADRRVHELLEKMEKGRR